MNIPKNLTPEQFRNHFEENYKDLNLIKEYTKGSEKVDVQCNIDDNIWSVFPRDVYSGEHMSCKSCNRRKANMDLRKKFIRSYPTMKIVTADIFSEDKTTIQCNVCKSRFEVYRKHLIGDNITNFSGRIDISRIILFKDKKKEFVCPVCKIDTVKEEFERVVSERECKIVGEYVSNTGPVQIECDHCHTQYSVVPQYYINKIVSKCKYCKKKPKNSKSWVSIKEIDWN